MSTILKALRRLEEDRSAQSQRPLREEVTRDAAAPKTRSVLRPLLGALLGLGVAAGAGALVFWYLGGAPDSAPSAPPAELAAADPDSSGAKPAATASKPPKRRAPRPARQRSSPSAVAAGGAASEGELPAGALASKVELLKRPPAEPRIAADEPAEPRAYAQLSGALPGPMDPAEIPGRHKPRTVRGSSEGPAPSVVAWAEAPEPPSQPTAPAGSRGESAAPVREARRPAAASTRPATGQPRAEPASEPLVVAAVPEPERTAPEPPPTPTKGAEPQSATPRTTPTAAATGKVSKPAAESAGLAPRAPEAPASSGITRAEIPGLRVERTVWHPTAERRLALIELDDGAERREIREGDAVGPLVVSEIEPSGVVFVHEGIEVRRRIGE
jgi:hypothetical protein